MTLWNFSPGINLSSDRIPADDASRQMVTAQEICRRFESQPGVILADDVGMGKTFVALAVAASVVMNNPDSQVVIMVPAAVGEKWPKDWSVFRDMCLPADHDIRATDTTIRRGQDFLRLLDDDPQTRKHIIFLSHRALTSSLNDPFIQLALVRHVFKRHHSLKQQERVFHRFAGRILQRRDLTPDLVRRLLSSNPAKWKDVWNGLNPKSPFDDDPIPESVLRALNHIDTRVLRDALESLPLRTSSGIDQRLRLVRSNLRIALNQIWKEALQNLEVEMPLLILDEAHHLKNPNKLRGLFSNDEGVDDSKIQGSLGGVFERMLLMTATPFQLGHRELVRVLRLFSGTRMNPLELDNFVKRLDELGNTLDAAQASSLLLEGQWSRLSDEEVSRIQVEGLDLSGGSESFQAVVGHARSAVVRLAKASTSLRPWVIRHSKDRRRIYLPGCRTLPGNEEAQDSGLEVAESSVLPFLLAARAQSLAGIRGFARKGGTTVAPTRALFADGLASSFETYLKTRGFADEDDGASSSAESISRSSAELDWYLRRITHALPSGDPAALAAHPKVQATVKRSLHHWQEGEKVLIFCFYRATGKALQEHIARAIEAWIIQESSRRFGIDGEGISDVLDKLSLRAESIFDIDSPGTRRLKSDVVEIGKSVGLVPEDADRLADVTHRFMKIPSFLLRYVDISSTSTAAAVVDALKQTDGGGTSLETRLKAFAVRIRSMTAEEKAGLWNSLETIGVDRTAKSIVALTNGETNLDRRRRVVDVFNSPFPPDILVTSSIMAEGVDLHRDCRHVIHHDLDWNPSTLEQRTGRVDRLGSKSLLSGQPVVVCEPFVAGTQDEKQFRVVKDRERWFGVLMGGGAAQETSEIDRLSERATLPENLLRLLTIDLSVWKAPTPEP